MTDLFLRKAVQYAEGDILRTGWSSKATQEERFRVLYEAGIENQSSVLDVGCGVGDFYQYLRDRGFEGQYLGCDLIEANCGICRKRFGDTLFLNRDILDFDPDGSFDFVIASGLFFIESSDWEATAGAIISKMYTICNKGAAFNFLSSAARQKIDGFKYTDPLEVIPMCRALTDKFTLRHEYSTKQNDFTVYLFREAAEIR